MTSTREVDLETGFRRVVVGYRAAAVVWMGLLALVTDRPGGLGAGVGVAAVVGLAGLWAFLTAILAAARPHVLRTVAWLAADVLVAAVTVFAPWVVSAAAGGEASLSAFDPFAGGYPFSAVLLAAWARGMPGALPAAVALSAAAVSTQAGRGPSTLDEALPSVLVYLAGAVVAAWGIGLLREQDRQRREALLALAGERAAAARERERAETAAHLHDSVLQTLALIQRRAEDPAAVRTLAREQEGGLRAWLSGQAAGAGTAAALLRERCAEVERDHAVPVEVVVRGDQALDEAVSALAAAAAEAVRNAARHSGAAQVSVYAEFGGAPAVFVRDRGRGFDPGAVPADRRGIAESIQGRLERHGGSALLHTAPGQGTEWELRLGREGA